MDDIARQREGAKQGRYTGAVCVHDARLYRDARLTSTQIRELRKHVAPPLLKVV